MIKLRYWECALNLPAASHRQVSQSQWLDALAGKGSGQTHVRWHLAGHRKVHREWDMGVRKLDDHLIYLLTDGCPIELTFGDQTKVESRRLLHPGTFMWLAPGMQHQLLLTNPEDPATLYHMRFSARLSRHELCIEPSVLLLEDAHAIQWEMEQIIDELMQQQSDMATRCRSLLVSMCVNVFRQLHRPTDAAHGLSGVQRGQLLEYVRQHATDWPSPGDLAKECGLSAGYFSRVFRASFGMSPRRWLVEQRIRLAARLIVESNMNVTQVADHLGYRDVYLFSRQFKQVTGQSPSRYRSAF